RLTEAGVEIARVRLADGEPFALERSTFPGRFAWLLDRDLTGSLYELLGDAEALGLRPGAPLMLVDRIAYDGAGEVVETARDVFRGDRTRIVAWTSELVRA